MRTRKHLLSGLLLAIAVIGSTLSASAQAPGANKPPAAAKVGPTGWVPKTLAYIKASNTSEDNQFGYSVSMSADGSTLAAGSVNEGSGSKGINGNQADHSARDSGAVYVYTRRPGAAWMQQAYIKASNPQEGAQFGNAVALSGDGNTLAVAAYLEDSGSTGVNGNQGDHTKDGSGAVYVFTRSGTTWSQQAYVKASNTGEGDQFGYSVALNANGNTLAVGAIEEASRATGVNGNQADDSAAGTGAAYVFARTGAAWSQQAYLKPEATGALMGYGIGVSADGNTVAVGAENDYNNGGAVYAFVRAGTTWSEQARLKSANEEGGDSIGWCVAISADGNTIVAGGIDENSLLTGVPPLTAGGNDNGRSPSTGAAYVFVRNGTAWTPQAWLKATNTRKNDQFGTSISISGDGNTVAVGSPFGDGPGGSTGVNADPTDNSVTDSGSVYVYTRSGTTWTPAAYVKAPNARVNAAFGTSVALNSDGKALAVGSLRENSSAQGVNGNQADTGARDAGAAYLYY
jgi:hypothetical protein